MTKKWFFFAIIAICASIAFNACKDKDDDDPIDDGKIDPSTIAAANLIAYFPFESETGSISKGDGITFGKKVGAASFVEGRRGNAYKGSANEAYLEFNVAASNPFKTMKEFTIAAWVKTPPAGGAAMIFQMNGGDDFMGNLDFFLEGGADEDELDFKGYLFNSASPEWKGQDIRTKDPAFPTDKWVHVAFSYNKATSTMSLWASGLLVFSQEKFAGPEDDDGSQPSLGDLVLGQNMTKINIGAWAQQIADDGQDWMKYYPGLLDELRIYNKALSEQEMKDLYDAEVTQINE